MPVALTNITGSQQSGITGGWIPTSETLIEGITAAGAQRRLILAQVSDIYLVSVLMQVTSNATAGRVEPQVQYFGYAHGAGQQLISRVVPSFDATDVNFTSAALLPIRAAASDIFISWDMSANGALPIVDLYWRISRSV